MTSVIVIVRWWRVFFFCGYTMHWFIEYNNFFFLGDTKSFEKSPQLCTDTGLWDYPSPALFNLPCTQELRLNLARSCQRSQPDTHINVPHCPSRGRSHCPAASLKQPAPPDLQPLRVMLNTLCFLQNTLWVPYTATAAGPGVVKCSAGTNVTPTPSHKCSLKQGSAENKPLWMNP